MPHLRIALVSLERDNLTFSRAMANRAFLGSLLFFNFYDMILLSYINTKLRDEFSSLEELSKSLCVSETEIEEKLGSIDYKYNAELNKFI